MNKSAVDNSRGNDLVAENRLEEHLDYLRDPGQLHESRNLADLGQSMDVSHLRSSNWSIQPDRRKFEMTHLLDSSSHKTWKKKRFESRRVLGTRAENGVGLEGHSSDTRRARPRGTVGESDLHRSTGSELRFSDEAVQLIRVSKEGQFEVTMEGLSLLRSFEGPIAVLGVAGKFRTGKSYLLNRVILRTENGFGVAPTINACTKGIWMYGRPIRVTLKDGRPASLVVLDSEGLDAIDQDASHDCRILALMMLLTSMFVYNSVGAIDENAISSLSLVINLTKHIRVRAKPGNAGDPAQPQTGNEDGSEEESDDEEDPEELAKFFPNFLWVLRDFSLELVDQNGREITPKDYLENALALHKGISDTVQEKNRLRRLICQFFPERNCFPLVRPLLDEEDLQRLNELPVSRLRREFVEGSQSLRERLFTQAKPKTLKSKSIDGTCLAGLIVQYVRAINCGAVPNIESAWTYVCSNQRETLKKELIAEFWETVAELTGASGPVEPREMQLRLGDLVKAFKQKFKKGSLDGLEKGEVRAFKEALCEIGERAEAENTAAVRSHLLEILEERFRREVAKRLETFEREKREDKKTERERHPESDAWVSREGETWSHVSQALKQFQTSIQDMGLQDQLQNAVASTFVAEKLETYAAKSYHSLRKTTEILKLSKNSKIKLLSETCDSQRQSIKEQRTEHSKRERQLTDRAQHLESERDLALRQTELKADEARNYLREREADLGSQIERLQGKLGVLEDEAQRTKEEREAVAEEHRQREAERETEVVLLAQKVEFLEKEKQDWLTRKLTMENERRAEEERVRKEMEDLRRAAEASARTMRGDMKNLETTMLEMREEATQQSFLQDNRCAEWTTKEDEIRLRLEETHREREVLVQKMEDQRDRQQEWERQIEDLRSELHKENTEKEQWKRRASEVEEKLKGGSQNSGTQKAVENQQLEFMREERDRARDELDKAKKLNKELVLLMDTDEKEAEEGDGSDPSVLERELQQVKERLREERKLKELAKKSQEKALLRQTSEKEKVQDKLESLRLTLDEKKKEREAEQARHSQIQAGIEEQKEKIIVEMKEMFNTKVQRLESELESVKGSESGKIQEVKNFHAQREREMREFFGEEKTRLERKMKKERDTWKFRLEELEDESEQRLGIERREREEETEAWEARVREAEQMGREWREQAEGERVERERELTRQLEAAKEDHTRLKGELEAAREESRRWGEEREVWRREKEEEFKGIKEELIEHKKEAQELGLQLQHAQETQIRAEKRLKECEKRWETERSESSKVREEWKRERYGMAEEILGLKMSLTQEVAVAQQKMGFKDTKILELEKQLDVLCKTAEAKRRSLEEDLKRQKENFVQKHEQEILDLEGQTTTLRGEVKTLQSEINEHSMEAEKARISLRDKSEQWEQERNRVQQKSDKESERLKSEVSRLREQIKKTTGIHQQEVEALRVLKFDAEIAFTETVARLDKETALWKSRERFLSEQRAQTQRELKEMEKSFQTVLNKLQEYRRREKTGNSGGDLARKLEETQREARARIDETEAVFRERESALAERIETLETELTRAEHERQGRMAAKFGQRLEEEKKLNQLLEREKANQDTIMMLKYQKDQITLEAQRELERERERLKAKIFKSEACYKTMENEKNLLIFEQEKQKTKWAIEKENIIYQKQEISENLQKLRRQKEHLTKENERLKGNIKVLKKSNLGHSIMSFARSRYYPGNTGTRGTRYSGEDMAVQKMQSNSKQVSGMGYTKDLRSRAEKPGKGMDSGFEVGYKEGNRNIKHKDLGVTRESSKREKERSSNRRGQYGEGVREWQED